MSNVYCVILAGGSGTRFWPASRRLRPKQLLSLVPGSSEPLIAETVHRISSVCPPNQVLVSTGAHLVEATRAALAWLPESAFLAEPVARNTAPCIAWATSVIARTDPDAVVMVVPSDQHIGLPDAYLATLRRALDSAAQGTITTIGLTPSRPETGYGYIELGQKLGADLHRVERFVEKPDLERARVYLQSGRHVWNSGMFFFRAATLLESVQRHLPELYAGILEIERAAAQSKEAELKAINAVFERTESVSIDYGIMERESALNVVVGDFGWSDLGSWHSAWELSEKDADGNAGEPSAIFRGAKNNLVRTLRSQPNARVIALVGVEDLCVIDTDDALLVIRRDKAQDVRSVVEALRARGQSSQV